jgi:drug/metabolite transporter (DMT)-like permease
VLADRAPGFTYAARSKGYGAGGRDVRMPRDAVVPGGQAGGVTDRSATPPLSLWLPPYLLLGAIWGCSFLFIKVADEQIPPVWVTLGRVAIGAATLLGALAVMRGGLPRDLRLWGHLFVIAAVMNAAPFTLFALAEHGRVSSVIAGVWNATTPLTALAVLIIVFPSERPTRARIGGLLIGFVGVLIVLGVWRGIGGTALTGQLMCFAAATCYGVGLPYIRRFISGRPESGVTIAAGQMLMATLQMAVVAPLIAGAPPSLTGLHLRVLGSLAALGALGTGIAFILNYRVIRLVGPGTTSTVTYLMPIFSTLAGVLVLGERIGWSEPVGAAVILVGVALSQGLLGSLPGRRRAPAVAPPAEVVAAGRR